MNKKEIEKILNKIPSSWDEMPFADFLLLVNVPIKETDEFDGLFVGTDNALKVLSILTGIKEGDLEELPGYVIQQLGSKLSFIVEDPKPKKESVFIWKKPEEITYSNFVTYQMFATNPFQNMPTIIGEYSKNGFTESEILQMSTTEVFTGFFLLDKQVKKSLKVTGRYLKVRYLFQLMKENLLHFKPKLKHKNKQ